MLELARLRCLLHTGNPLYLTLTWELAYRCSLHRKSQLEIERWNRQPIKAFVHSSSTEQMLCNVMFTDITPCAFP